MTRQIKHFRHSKYGKRFRAGSRKLKRINHNQFMFGDFDGDGVRNHRDCRPFDFRRQDEPQTEADYQVKVRNSLRAFKTSHPWRGTVEERKDKFRQLHDDLNGIYGRNVKLHFGVSEDVSRWTYSGESFYRRSEDSITLKGKLSVITFLHEWGHALGMGEIEAQQYATGHFKEVFPDEWSKLRLHPNGVMMVTR